MSLRPSSRLDPFHLTVPHPSLRLVLTAPRDSDRDAVLQAHNDPRVYMNLEGPAYPYTIKDWQNWHGIITDAAETCLLEWEEKMKNESGKGQEGSDQGIIPNDDDRKWVGSKMWVSAIREVISPPALPLQSGSALELAEPFIGDIAIRRSGLRYILDDKQRQIAVEHNAELSPGDPAIIWEIGFYLTPAVHGKGIMPAVLRTLIREVLIPYMNVHTLVAEYIEYNLASRRVFEKCDFHFLKFIPDASTLAESKLKEGDETGKKHGVGIMLWKKHGGS